MCRSMFIPTIMVEATRAEESALRRMWSELRRHEPTADESFMGPSLARER